MTLIKSISGIRGTIGGKVNESLTPFDALKYSISYGNMLKSKYEKPVVVIGRDARMSGNMIKNIVISGLNSIGVNVIDLDLSTTPTVEFSVVELNAQGGIIITASHNPKEWNALKLLNHRGEFISDAEGKEIVAQADALDGFEFEHVDHLGKCVSNNQMLDKHIEKILRLDYIDKKAIEACNPKIVVDAINSTGAIAVQKMLDALNIKEYEILNAEMHGNFNHNPEPLAQHLTQISDYIKKHKMDLGIVVDPDVDRLCFVNEDGSMFGEEYTLVAVADFLLSKKSGNTVSNLSSTRALRDITSKYGGQYFASAVGEVNVVKMMKENHALIGGEGNGGVIFPENHYGRDALVGIALFLSYYAEKNLSMTQIKNALPQYFMSKNKIELTPEINVDEIINQLHQFYKDKESCSVVDGLKIDWENGWVHLRKSNTEPIIRIYSEAKSQDEAEALANKIIVQINEIIA